MIDSEQWSSVKKPVAEKPSATEQKKTESKKAKKPEQKIRHSWFRKDDQRQQIIIALIMLVVFIGVPLILLAVALKLIYYVLFVL